MLKTGAKCANVEIFMERFLRSEKEIKKTTTVQELYKVWFLFLENYLKLHWPQEWQNYNSYLVSMGMCLGLAWPQESELADAITMFSFPDCVDFLTQKHKMTKRQYCTLTKENNHSGFVLIGNILWSTNETGIEWNLE